MRVVDRKTFLGLPEGTFYCKGERWCFDDMCLKGESLSNDWFYLSFNWIESDDSGMAFDRLEDMAANGASYPMEDAWTRDGCFDDDALFLVFERDDLERLRGLIDKTLGSANG
jgi:hypothetical protein